LIIDFKHPARSITDETEFNNFLKDGDMSKFIWAWVGLGLVLATAGSAFSGEPLRDLFRFIGHGCGRGIHYCSPGYDSAYYNPWTPRNETGPALLHHLRPTGPANPFARPASTSHTRFDQPPSTGAQQVPGAFYTRPNSWYPPAADSPGRDFTWPLNPVER